MPRDRHRSGPALSDHEDALIWAALKGAVAEFRADTRLAVPSESLLLDTPAAIEAYALRLDKHNDVIAHLQASADMSSREEVIRLLLSLAPKLRGGAHRTRG